MATQYSVLIGGSEVDFWESIDFENSLDLSVNRAQIQFPDSTDLLAAEGIGADVQIVRDGVTIWRGIGLNNQKIYGADDKKQYNLICASNKIYLQKEIFQKSGLFALTYGGNQNSNSSLATPPSTSATSIFQDILNSQTVSTLRAGQLGTSSIPHAALYITRQTALQVLSQLLAGTLWEARFNTDNTVDFLPKVGSQTSVYTFQSEENMMKTEVDYGIDKLVNQVFVCGAGSTTNQITNLTAKNQSSIDQFGAWSKVANLPNCSDQNLLQAYANALLNDLSSDIYTVKGQVADLSTGVPFQVGDTVTVNNPSFNLSDALFRVISEQRHYDSQQGEDVNVVLAQNYRMVDVNHFKLKRLEDILNSQLQSQQIFNNNFNQTPTSLPLQVTNTQSATVTVGHMQNYTAYVVVSVSGINAGFTPFATQTPGQAGVAVTASNAQDLTTLKNYTPGAFNSDDIYDHVFEITMTVNNVGGSNWSGQVNMGITLSQPTIPT